MENSNKCNLGESSAHNNGLIKQGYLDLCYLNNVSSNDIGEQVKSTVAGLRSQPVQVSVHRRPGEFFAILQFQSGATSCLNLRHCRAEPCENRRYLKLMLNDFTSGLLFRICQSPPNPVVLLAKQNEMQQERLQQEQQLVLGEILDDLSVINKNQDHMSAKDSHDEQKQLDWVQAFSEPAQWPAKLCPSFGFRRSQSLQTVYESDEELEEEEEVVHQTTLMV